MSISIRDRCAVVLVVGVMAAGLAVVPAAGGTAALRVPTLHWASCGGPYQCARARVPLDYDEPHGPTISLALIRLPASEPSRRIGSLFVNPGGPGGSGVDLIRSGAAQVLWTSQVRARFDIVGFDPRGVARSSPLRCFATNDAESQFFGASPGFPYKRSQIAPYISLVARFGQQCLRHGGPIMRHMSTANVARDLDLLRRAVGDDKLTYDGVSYGSMIGSNYAALFPKRIRALVIDGVLDPVSWTTGRPPRGSSIPSTLRLGSVRGSEGTLDQFTKLCDAAGTAACPLAPRSRAKLDRLRARLLQGPVELGPSDSVTYDAFIGVILDALSDTPSWGPVSELLAGLYATAFPPSDRAARPRLAPSLTQGWSYDNYTESFLGVLCADSVNPHNPYVWPRAIAHREAHGAPFFAAIWGWTGEPCATWPVTDHDRYLGPFNRTTSAPVLVIGNLHDPDTPYSGAKATAARLPRSRLLTLDGSGHTSWGQSACIDRNVARYLIRGTLPPVGTTCTSDVQPFTPEASSDRAATVRPVLRTASRPSWGRSN